MNVRSVMTRTVFVKKKINLLIFIFLALSFVFLLGSCSKDDEEKDDTPKQEPVSMRIIDDWKFSFSRSFVIMSFKANGSWEAQVREEEKLTRVVKKKASQKGTWELIDDDQLLKLNVLSGDEVAYKWKVGNSYTFSIAEFTDDFLVLIKTDSSRKFELTRLKAKKTQAKAEDGSALISIRTRMMKPIIVNLKKRNKFEKNRFICVTFNLIEDLEVPVATIEEMPPENPLDPRIRENIIIYLSSLTYREINTFKEVRATTSTIEEMISPYFSGLLHELKLDNIIVAGSRGSLEEYIIQYPDQMIRFGLAPAQPAAPPEGEEAEAEKDEKA